MNKSFVKYEKIFERKMESIKGFPLIKDYKIFISDISEAFDVKNKKQIYLKVFVYYEIKFKLMII
jgi:hypothetical protein